MYVVCKYPIHHSDCTYSLPDNSISSRGQYISPFHYRFTPPNCILAPIALERQSCQSTHISWETDKVAPFVALRFTAVISLENDHSVAIRQSTQPPRKKENKTAAERESFSLSFKGGPGQIKKHPTRLSSKEQSALWVAPSLYSDALSWTCKHQPLQDLSWEWRTKANALSSSSSSSAAASHYTLILIGPNGQI